jgi:hypothetical protein
MQIVSKVIWDFLSVNKIINEWRMLLQDQIGYTQLVANANMSEAKQVN